MNNVGSLLVQKAYHQRSPGRSDRRKIFNAERKEIASATLATARTPQLQKRFEISRLDTSSYIEIPPRNIEQHDGHHLRTRGKYQ